MEVLVEGQKIKHGQYGLGVVTEANEDRTTIEFDEFGLKKFVTSMMTAELVGEALSKPVRTKRRRKVAKAASK